MTSLATPQFTFDFEPSLPERFASLRSYVAFRVQEQRLNAAGLAGKMDLSPSVLSRKLNQPDGDTQRFNVDDLEGYIKATGDVQSVIEYLAAKYLDSEESRRTRALARVETLLAELTGVAASLKAVA
jgi:hypothetical protein